MDLQSGRDYAAGRPLIKRVELSEKSHRYGFRTLNGSSAYRYLACGSLLSSASDYCSFNALNDTWSRQLRHTGVCRVNGVISP